jgi:hypothetical protein
LVTIHLHQYKFFGEYAKRLKLQWKPSVLTRRNAMFNLKNFTYKSNNISVITDKDGEDTMKETRPHGNGANNTASLCERGSVSLPPSGTP